MASIKKGEVDFLETLYHKIENDKNLTNEVNTLRELIFDLDARNNVLREKSRALVSAKRREDPLYGRSADERERILNRKTKSNV